MNEERYVLFEALLYCIESNSGIGFPRYDQSHPDYHDGKKGRPPLSSSDTEEKNVMFQMLRELSLHLADQPPVTTNRRFGITTWVQFCERAVAARANKGRRDYQPLYLRKRKSSS